MTKREQVWRIKSTRVNVQVVPSLSKNSRHAPFQCPYSAPSSQKEKLPFKLSYIIFLLVFSPLHLSPPPLASPWSTFLFLCTFSPCRRLHTHITYTPHTEKQRGRRLLGLVIITFDLLFSSWCFTQQLVEWQWQFNAHTPKHFYHFSTLRLLFEL